MQVITVKVLDWFLYRRSMGFIRDLYKGYSALGRLIDRLNEEEEEEEEEVVGYRYD